MPKDEEEARIIDILDEHGVDEPAAWRAALELEIGQQSGPIDQFLDSHGEKVLDLCSTLIGAPPRRQHAATDGGGVQDDDAHSRRSPRHLKGSPQRQKFVGRGGAMASGPHTPPQGRSRVTPVRSEGDTSDGREEPPERAQSPENDDRDDLQVIDEPDESDGPEATDESDEPEAVSD